MTVERRSFVRLPSLRNAARGFTLIELLVVAPIAIIVIATLISLMVALVGDVAVSRERSVSTYDVQDALDRIEQDARIATTYMPSFSLFVSPQGENDATAAFTSASGDLIMSQYATTANPYDVNRKVVYYADQPYACTGTYTLNRPMTNRVIYFTKVTGGVTSLWRRVIVPDGSTSDTGTTKLCDNPWQRNSCSDAFAATSPCQTRDEKMLDYVSSFAITYYNQAGGTLTAAQARDAASIKVSLTQTKSISGESVATNGVARASHINVTTDDIPAVPTGLSVYNPAVNTYNNPVLTTFEWDVVKNAAVYSVRYQINGGSWVNAPDQTSNRFQVTSARPKDAITIRVAAKNDMGVSAETAYSYTTPLWTVANLEGSWDCYQPSEVTWSCPAYTLLSSNVIVMRGLAAGGSGVIFNMPQNLRPTKVLLFPTLANQPSPTYIAAARVDVADTGAVTYLAGGNNVWVSLDKVRYIPSSISQTWTIPTFSNGWSSYSGGTSGHKNVEYTKDSMGRTHLSGVLTVGTTTAGLTIHSLPAGYDEYGGIGIYTSFGSGSVSNAFQVSSGVMQARGQGVNWMGENVIYPSTTSGAAFVSVAPQAGWTNYGGAYATAKYSKTSDGLVVLQGLIVPTTVTQNTVLFTLPAGYRPAKQMLFGVADSGAGTYAGQEVARIDVETNGQVSIIFNVTSGTWLSLEGINFYQEL
jgi:type II secretory pathway pseudopilin PulG